MNLNPIPSFSITRRNAAMRPLVVSGWIMGSASLRGEVDVWAGLLGGFQSLATLPTGILQGSHLVLGDRERDPGHPYYVATHVAYTSSYALTLWSLVLLTLGVFQKICPRPNALVRYVADSSYWMYLIHLPIVVWLQVAIAELAQHWSLKLAFVSTLTIAIALLTYDLFVRSTFIGWVLNGGRRERVVACWMVAGVRQRWPGKPLRPLTER